MGFTVGAVLLLIVVMTIRLNARQRKLSKVRLNLEPDDFLNSIPVEIDPILALYVRGWASHYLVKGVLPHPTDRVESDLAIDPEDMEDMAAKFWANNDLPRPTRQDPEILPADPSILQLIEYLEQRRRELTV